MRRAVVAVAASAVLAGVQWLVSATPVTLVEGDAAAYRLTQTGRTTAELTLYGRGPATAGPVIAVPVTEVRTPGPVRAPTTLGRPAVDRRLALQLQLAPGTYKLTLPRTRPFGLLSVDPA